MTRSSEALATLAALALAGCGSTSSDAGMLCAPGTHVAFGQCIPDLAASCGPGTHAEGTTCYPDGGGVACGAGTHLVDGACARDSGVVTCGAGTVAVAGACLPSGSSMSCGAGTHLEGLLCLPDPLVTCGAGTHLVGAACLPDAVVTCGAGAHLDAGRCLPDAATTFELRVAATTLPADGYSKIPVLVLGRNADGTASAADVVLWVGRPGSGTFSQVNLALGPLGAMGYFIPCSSASPGCVGDTELRASLASDSATPVASLAVTLVAPAGVGSPAACLTGGNVLFFDGSGYIFSGTQAVTVGTFTAPNTAADDVRLWITPSDPAQGMWWDLTFSSRQLGQPLAAQVYDGAQRAPFASPGHPGIDIGGDGRGCNTISGRFEVQELAFSGPALSRFTATFEQFCEASPANVLRGCVHYQQ